MTTRRATIAGHIRNTNPITRIAAIAIAAWVTLAITFHHDVLSFLGTVMTQLAHLPSLIA